MTVQVLRSCVLAVSVATCLISFATRPAQAIVINDFYFASSGGATTDVAGTLDTGYQDAREASYVPQLQAVGAFGICTGTWIGNDTDSSFFLSVAHCFQGSTTETPVTLSFTDYAGNVVASGSGTFHVPPERINRPPGLGGASTDIGIVELPGLTSIQRPDGKPIFQPMLYDGNQEFGKEITLAGYGSWGIGSQGSNGGLFPSSGPRRAAATNVIDRFFESDHGIGYSFDAPGTGDATLHEGSSASGDSGSAWWQEHAGASIIIAANSGGSGTSYGTFGVGARVSQWIDWIESIHPDVLLFSEQLTGVDGDVNQDGLLNQLDINDFVTGWNSDTTSMSIPNATKQGDLNLDGITSLQDAFLLHEALRAGGSSISLSAVLAGAQVPEPSNLVLIFCSCIVLNVRQYVRRSPS